MAMRVHSNSAALVTVAVAAVAILVPNWGLAEDSSDLNVLSPGSPELGPPARLATFRTETIGSVMQPPPQPSNIDLGYTQAGDPERFSIGSRPFDVGTDFYSPPEFEGGLKMTGRMSP